MSHALDDLIFLAERTYVRWEAEQLIEDCLIKANPEPFNKLLEELVIAGTDSLVVLREILIVIRSVKSTLNQAGMGLQHDLKKNCLSLVSAYHAFPQLGYWNRFGKSTITVCIKRLQHMPRVWRLKINCFWREFATKLESEWPR